MLVLSVLMVRVWRDRGVARRLIAVRDNEVAAGSAGIPVVRTKLLAFALSGFIAGYAGVCLAFATERFSTDTFDPTFSILVVSMVVIGGLDSIPGALLGALYLEGLPAIFGSTPTVEFLTSGAGLLVFILYLPGGMAQVLHRFGDLATSGVENLRARWGGRTARRSVRHPVGRPGRRSGRPPCGPAQPGRGRGALHGRSVTGTGDAGRPATAAPTGRPARQGPARLDIEELVVAYGGLRAVNGASLAVDAGSIVGLIGANGSGKTTLLDAVSGLVSPTEGKLLLDQVDMADYRPEERARLGMVRSFQDCRLYPELTVEDTLMLCEDARRRVSVLARPPCRCRGPGGPSGRSVRPSTASSAPSAWSGSGSTRRPICRPGTRRVVDLASIVLANPRLLLLDEPTAGIAQREAEAFIPLLQRLHEVTDSTILLVEHDVPLVFELCSTVVVMQAGEVVAAGTPDEVRRDPQALAAYLGASDEALNVSGPLAASSTADGRCRTAGRRTPGRRTGPGGEGG